MFVQQPCVYQDVFYEVFTCIWVQSVIIKDSVFHDYYLFKPQAFKNVTNGIAYRRWLLASGRELKYHSISLIFVGAIVDLLVRS